MTLRVRILALVGVFAIFLIAGFAAIQVVNQLQILNTYNAYRVRVGSSSAKTSLEVALAVHQAQHPKDDPVPMLKTELARIGQSELFDGAVLLTPEGQTLFALGNVTGLEADDGRWAPFAVGMYTKEHWCYTSVTPGAVHNYVPLTLQQKPRYVVRFTFALANVRQAIREVYKLSAMMILVVFALSALFAWFLTRAILEPIQTLNEATHDIAAGNLSLKVRVATGDELEELATTFNEMTDALARLKARAENANPLTKLPGNTMIHEEIERRIISKKPFVAVYADLDNFKAFNDKYGIGAGDEVIRLTAKLLKEAMKRGNPEDFLGHEGGDDFVLLTTPEKLDAVSHFICTEFDQRIRALYHPEDLARGGITSKDREGNTKEFPIMTVSLAGATNVHRPLNSYAEVTNILAEVKKRAKISSKEAVKSTMVLDRRRSDAAAPTPAATSLPQPPAGSV